MRTEPPPLIGGRFHRQELLGAGAHGQVYGALDALTGQPAALKWMPDPQPAAIVRFRREVAALRALRLPWVVPLLDAGELDEGLWLAMPRVAGRPFPGPGRDRWAALAPPLDALLGALAAVHRLGLVHRDLKPANVLVTPSGQPILLDFGLVWGAAVGAERVSDGAGTPGYMAPEQRAGEAIDARADLYAVGVMALEALDGDPDLPPAVEAALQAMIAPDPEERPASASEALVRLGRGGQDGARAAVSGRLPPDRAATEAELQAIFFGPDRLLHLAQDGARALWLRTGGDPTAVVEVCAAWVREGLGRWVDGRLDLPRESLDALDAWAWPTGEARLDALPAQDAAWLPWVALLGADATQKRLAAVWPEAPAPLDLPRLQACGALLVTSERLRVLAWPPGFRARLLPVPRPEAHRRAAALLPPGAPGRLRHRVAAGASPAEIAADAASCADRLLLEGRPAEAITALDLALPGVRRDAGPGRLALLRCWARAALSLQTPAALDRALFEVGRVDGLQAEQALLVASRRSLDGDGDAALAGLDVLGPLDDAALEIWRQAMRVHASWRCRPPRVAEVLDGLDAWAQGHPEREAARDGWRGMWLYVQERYAEAAACHERAALGKPSQSAARSSWLNAASAWLDHGDPARAADLARRALDSADAARHALHALEAERLLRAARIRQGEGSEAPDTELVAVAAALGRPAQAAAVALGEAALAFHQGRWPLGAALAAQAARGFAQEHLDAAALLAEALAQACAPGSEEQRAGLLDQVSRCPVPGLAVQAAALLAWREASPALRARAWAEVAAVAPRVSAPPEMRQEVLSLAEITRHLGG